MNFLGRAENRLAEASVSGLESLSASLFSPQSPPMSLSSSALSCPRLCWKWLMSSPTAFRGLFWAWGFYVQPRCSSCWSTWPMVNGAKRSQPLNLKVPASLQVFIHTRVLDHDQDDLTWLLFLKFTYLFIFGCSGSWLPRVGFL